MTSPFPAGQYGVIYLDPPWLYRMRTAAGHGKSPHAHYPGMTLDEMKALRDDILFASAPDCVMFMWTTWPALPDANVDFIRDAMDLMQHYGFARKSGGVWNKTTVHGKQSMGTGYIFRGASEPFFIGTRGRPRIKNKSTRNAIFTGELPENLNDLGVTVTAAAREHSRKPDIVPQIIEALFDGPYLELFSRTTRPGWTVWGNETDKFKTEDQP